MYPEGAAPVWQAHHPHDLPRDILRICIRRLQPSQALHHLVGDAGAPMMTELLG